MTALDLAGHILWAVLLPGHWWYQFLPDVLLPYTFIRSLVSDRLLPEKDAGLFLHKFFHTIWPALFLVASFPAVGAQWVTHIIQDQFTHPEPEFRRSLLWPKNLTQ